MLQPPSLTGIPEMAILGSDASIIILTEALPFDITVTVKPTANCTATMGVDFTIASENVVVKAGETAVSLQLKLIDDRIREKTEYIELEIVNISDTTRATLSSQRICKIEVLDND